MVSTSTPVSFGRSEQCNGALNARPRILDSLSVKECENINTLIFMWQLQKFIECVRTAKYYRLILLFSGISEYAVCKNVPQSY